MSLILKQEPNNYTPAPEGNHPAVCVGVVDLGVQRTNFDGQEKDQHKVLIIWELPYEEGKNDQPIAVSKRYTLSFNERANLYQDLISWRGRAFTDEELQGFDLFNVIGAACFVNVIHESREGKTYAKVKSITPIAKGMEKPVPRTEHMHKFSLATSTLQEFEALPERLQAVISKSLSKFEFDVRVGRAQSNDRPVGLVEDYPMNDGDMPF